MKFCDECEKDVEKPCLSLEDALSCPSFRELNDPNPVKFEIKKKVDYELSSIPKETFLDATMELVNTEAKGQRGRSDDPNVDHPSHYNRGNIEVKDFIKDQKFAPDLANAVKYICRAGFKDPENWEQDLDKAIWYIRELIDEVNDTGQFPYMAFKEVPRDTNKPAGTDEDKN